MTIACALFAGMVLIFVLGREKEPSYQGRFLSQWLAYYEEADTAGRSSDVQIADTAVRAIGTNALPFLLNWLNNDTPGWRIRFDNLCNSVLWRINPNWVSINDDIENQVRARYAFKILGTNAAPAIPRLAELLTGSNGLASYHAAISLAYTGEEAWPVLLDAFTTQDPSTWNNVCLAISEMGTNAESAAPIMVRYLKDQNTTVRLRAATVLARLPMDPNLVVPPLIERLDDADRSVRDAAIEALTQYGDTAIEAVPKLIRLRTDPNQHTQVLITHALRQISPESLLNTPSQ